MSIRYKVVNTDRTSCFVGWGTDPCKYTLTYKKGEIIDTYPGTIGIFVFKKRKDAKTFMNFNKVHKGLFKENHKYYNWMIIKVLGIGKGHPMPIRPTNFDNHSIRLLGSYKDVFLKTCTSKKKTWKFLNHNNLQHSSFKTKDDGTILYQSVKVLT